jgi:hypothetical protein
MSGLIEPAVEMAMAMATSTEMIMTAMSRPSPPSLLPETAGPLPREEAQAKTDRQVTGST